MSLAKLLLLAVAGVAALCPQTVDACSKFDIECHKKAAVDKALKDYKATLGSFTCHRLSCASVHTPALRECWQTRRSTLARRHRDQHPGTPLLPRRAPVGPAADTVRNHRRVCTAPLQTKPR